jgi:hypothetical protein
VSSETGHKEKKGEIMPVTGRRGRRLKIINKKIMIDVAEEALNFTCRRTCFGRVYRQVLRQIV